MSFKLAFLAAALALPGRAAAAPPEAIDILRAASALPRTPYSGEATVTLFSPARARACGA